MLVKVSLNQKELGYLKIEPNLPHSEKVSPSRTLLDWMKTANRKMERRRVSRNNISMFVDFRLKGVY